MSITFKTIDQLRVELVAHTVTLEADTNFMPCTAARVSHGREDKTGSNEEADKRLMRFLAEHAHLSPFEHQSATFLIEAPLFVAREWMRHRTQSFNEISMRYTSDPADTYWIPKEWRAQDMKNKQSCIMTKVASIRIVNDVEAWDVETENAYMLTVEQAVNTYNAMIAAGVAREIARAVLPVGMVTRFFATANLRNWAHWYMLRSGDGAQEEIRHYATEIDKQLTALWPDAWGTLKETTNGSN